MPLAVGTRLGVYEVTGVLGAGGMGEVYRARDSKLGRAVAVKVVRDELGADPDRISRFEREAKMLAALNHPHIAALYGMDVADGRHFLVMELIEGETLADRLRRGPLPVDETLKIAQQITDALEAAHERGIVHRDLKPANVKITPDDNVKVLDFGLAKAMENERTASSMSDSPTLSMMASQAGIILGTAAYMSPEQAKGFPADHRSDVFSFGVVVYEMLTGRQPFQGDTAAEVLASVLVRDPELSRLPAGLNPRLGDLIRRCLEKSAKRRWQAIGDVRAEIEAIAAMPEVMPAASLPVAPPRPLWRRALPVAVAAVVTGGMTAAAAWYFKPAPLREVARLVIALPEESVPAGRNPLAISPDGQSIVFAAGRRLFLRSLSSFDVKPLPGTDSQDIAVVPAFSPDGRSIAFFATADASIKRLDLAGAVAHTVSPATVPFAMSWGPDGILVADADGISLVSPRGGPKARLIPVKDDETATSPQQLPGGQILFAIATGQGLDRWDRAQIVVQAPGSSDRRPIINGGSDPRYLPTGHIVYSLGGSLMAIAFDVRRLETRGNAIPVLEGVRRSTSGASGAANYAVSDTGSLIYVAGPTGSSGTVSEIILSDRKGVVETLKLPAGAYSEPRVSPDGQRIAFTSGDKDTTIWVYDLAGTSAMRRLTYGGSNRHPVWSSDSTRVTFQSDREGDPGIFWQLADGSGGAERLTRAEPGVSHDPESWSAKGDALLFAVRKGNERSLWIYSAKTKTSEPFGGIRSTNQIGAVFSPDAAWVAYATNESGRSFVYVQPYPATGARYQATAQPGPHSPLWSPDSKELLFNPGPLAFQAVTFSTKPAVAFGNPVAVPRRFQTGPPQLRRQYDMTRSGKILGLNTPGLSQTGAPAPILVVLNWFEELKQRMAR